MCKTFLNIFFWNRFLNHWFTNEVLANSLGWARLQPWEEYRIFDSLQGAARKGSRNGSLAVFQGICWLKPEIQLVLGLQSRHCCIKCSPLDEFLGFHFWFLMGCPAHHSWARSACMLSPWFASSGAAFIFADSQPFGYTAQCPFWDYYLL